MSDYETTEALTNYQRSLEHIGQALLEAGLNLTETDDNITAARIVERALARRDMLIDILAVDLTLRCLVGFEAAKGNVDPRHILEAHYKAAPTAEHWQELLERNRPEPDDDGA